jgi:hypothetical protein
MIIIIIRIRLLRQKDLMLNPYITQDSSPFFIRDINRLDSTDILPRHTYAGYRQEWLPRMSDYLRNRRIRVNKNVSLLFENAITVRHQIQEVMYWETSDDNASHARINEELDIYRTLLPTPCRLAATLLIDGGSPEKGIEFGRALASDRSSFGLAIGEAMIPARLADPDPDPAEPVKFLRFDLSPKDRHAILSGSKVSVWIVEGENLLTQNMHQQTVACIAGDLQSNTPPVLSQKLTDSAGSGRYAMTQFNSQFVRILAPSPA